MKVDLDHVIAFWAVATEGSFTKAGNALNSCQSRMSAKVKALEERLGTRLFTRSTRFVELTSAGRLLLTHATRLAETVAEIEAVTDKLARSNDQVLRMGAPGCTALTPERAMLTDIFERRRPEIGLEIEEGLPMVLLDRLLRHQVDVALIPGPILTDELDLLPLRTVHNMLVIPENHILARSEVVPAERMKGQQVVFSAREVHPALYDDLIDPLEKLGATIVVCPDTHTRARMRYAKTRGMVTWCQGYEDLNFAEDGFVLRPIQGLSSEVVLYLARRKDCELPHVEKFWSCARSFTSDRLEVRRAS